MIARAAQTGIKAVKEVLGKVLTLALVFLIFKLDTKVAIKFVRDCPCYAILGQEPIGARHIRSPKRSIRRTSVHEQLTTLPRFSKVLRREEVNH